MYTISKTRIVGCCVFLFVALSGITMPQLTQASSVTAVPTLTPENKAILIQLLMAQLQSLQAQLALLQQESAKSATTLNEFGLLLSPLRVDAELEYNAHNSYGSVCSLKEVLAVRTKVMAKGGVFNCAAVNEKFAIAAAIDSKISRARCVDSTGLSREISAAEYAGVGASAACDARDQQLIQEPAPVTAADFTEGAADAKIKIVTFTDLDCPFCKQFHATLASLVDANTNVSVTYRHFPLEQLHPNAMSLAVAAECVGQLGGDAAFWKFTDSIFYSRDVNEQTNMSKLPAFATAAGVATSAFATCRQNQTMKDAVVADIAEGTRSGVQGTPQSYLFKEGKLVGTINGAQPLSAVTSTVERLLGM